LQQSTRIEFSRIRRNPQLAAALFTFVPPPGVDVIGAPQG
jgi:outer membrane lipoprotein-sorting protein